MQTDKISMDVALKKQNCNKAAAYSEPDKQVIQNKWNMTCSFITSSLTAWSKHYHLNFVLNIFSFDITSCCSSC